MDPELDCIETLNPFAAKPFTSGKKAVRKFRQVRLKMAPNFSSENMKIMQTESTIATMCQFCTDVANNVPDFLFLVSNHLRRVPH